MAEQPLLSTYQSEPNLQFQDQEEENHDLGSEISFMFPQSIRNQVILEKIEDPFLDFHSKSPHKTNHGIGGGPSNGGDGGRRRKYGLHRSKTAPAIVIMRELKQNNQPQMEKPKLESSSIISKSEYVIYKLKEMGKTCDKDVLQICNEFNKLDPNNSGKITLPDLLQNRML